MKKLITIVSPILIFQLIILLLLNYQCDKRTHSKELSEKVFVQVYCDVVTYADVVNSKQREAFVDSVLNRYNTSREQFQYAVDSFSKDERKWEKVFTKIVEELERREKEMTTGSDSTHVMNP